MEQMCNMKVDVYTYYQELVDKFRTLVVVPTLHLSIYY